jgi:hypothetical protein
LPSWGRCVSVDASAAAVVPAASFYNGSFTCEGKNTSTRHARSTCPVLAPNEWLANANYWAVNETVHTAVRSSENNQQLGAAASGRGSSTASSTSTASSAGTVGSTSTASSIYSLHATVLKKSTADSSALSADEKRAVPVGFTCRLVSAVQFAGYWLCSTTGVVEPVFGKDTHNRLI